MQGFWDVPAPWQDTPIIRPFESNFNDYLMRVQSSSEPSGKLAGDVQSAEASFSESYCLPLYASWPSSAIVRRSSIT